MTENDRILNTEDEDPLPPPSIIITEPARLILNSVENILSELAGETGLDPSDDEFYYRYLTLLEQYDELQRIVLKASGIDSVCGEGCSCCCFHWVEDVNSFEAMIMGRYIEENFPEKRESIKNTFFEDQNIFDSMRDAAEKMTPSAESGPGDIPDSYDLHLSLFYQMRRPCALLDGNGRCIVYPVRPLTCRDYLNLRDPAACLPERIDQERYATLIISVSDTIIEPLEILHQRFDFGSGSMSLRKLIPRYLARRSETAE